MSTTAIVTFIVGGLLTIGWGLATIMISWVRGDIEKANKAIEELEKGRVSSAKEIQDLRLETVRMLSPIQTDLAVIKTQLAHLLHSRNPGNGEHPIGGGT